MRITYWYLFIDHSKWSTDVKRESVLIGYLEGSNDVNRLDGAVDCREVRLWLPSWARLTHREAAETTPNNNNMNKTIQRSLNWPIISLPLAFRSRNTAAADIWVRGCWNTITFTVHSTLANIFEWHQNYCENTEAYEMARSYQSEKGGYRVDGKIRSNQITNICTYFMLRKHTIL